MTPQPVQSACQPATARLGLFPSALSMLLAVARGAATGATNTPPPHPQPRRRQSASRASSKNHYRHHGGRLKHRPNNVEAVHKRECVAYTRYYLAQTASIA